MRGVPGYAEARAACDLLRARVAGYPLEQIADGLAGYRLGENPIGIGTISFPLLKFPLVNLHWMIIPFFALVIVGCSNAVNLTDGLDGLAIMPTVLVGGALGLFAYLVGHAEFAQ